MEQVMHESLIDLASARLGGKALFASDEFFAPKENLLAPGRGEFIEGKYTDRGKWMDGWETRRRRDAGGGYDWCVIQLGVPGAIRAITVDTNHFRGNHPAACSVDGASLSGTVARKRLRTLDRAFTEVLARSPLTGHAENRFTVESHTRCTHVRLNIYPDGGVARLRVWGEARPDWQRIARAGRTVDLVAVEHGGLPLATSDQFFSEPVNLIMPGRSRDMGDGWETRRRRGRSFLRGAGNPVLPGRAGGRGGGGGAGGARGAGAGGGGAGAGRAGGKGARGSGHPALKGKFPGGRRPGGRRRRGGGGEGG